VPPPWPTTEDELVVAQQHLSRATPPKWEPTQTEALGGCFVCFARGPSGPGVAGEPGWAGAAVVRGGRFQCGVAMEGVAGAPYRAGLLALREAALLEEAVRGLPHRPDVLLVNATGRDHVQRAGLALHLGAVLDLPTVGVTHRPLVAVGDWPDDQQAATSPLLLEGELVGYWVRTRAGRRPLAVSGGWRIEPDAAVEVVLRATAWARTPESLRQARRLARNARAARSTGLGG
jgi:deoxyribonuclease V